MTLYALRPRTPNVNYSGLLGGSVGLSGNFSTLLQGGGAFAGPLIALLPTGMSWDTSIGAPSGTPAGMSTTFPTFSGTEHVCSTVADVNNALASHASGDIITIDTDLILTTSIKFPNKGSSHRAWIRGSNYAALNAAKPYSSNYLTCTKAANRVSIVDDAANLRKLIVRANNQNAIEFDNGAAGYWFTGLEIYTDSGFITQDALVPIRGRTSQSQESDQPTNITLDRCYLHSFPGANNVRRAVLHAGNKILIVGSVIKIAFETGTNTDTQAILISNGSNLLVYNSQLEAAIENMMSGGLNISITNFDPNNAAFIRNEWSKDVAWIDNNSQKNVWEKKHGVQMLFFGNVITHYYAGPQFHIVVGNNANQSGNNPWSKVRDICYWGNKVVGTGIEGSFFGYSVNGSNAGIRPVSGTSRIEFAHNSFPGPQLPISPIKRNHHLSGGSSNPPVDWYIHHNLLCEEQALMYFGNSTSFAQGTGFNLSDNVWREEGTNQPLFADGGPSMDLILSRIYGTSWTVRNNWKKFNSNPARNWDFLANSPHNNATFTDENLLFVDPAGGNFRLQPTHAASGTGLAGDDPGPNHDLLDSFTAGVT